MFHLPHRRCLRFLGSLIAITLVIFSAAVTALDSEAVERALDERDYEALVRHLQPLVDVGNEEAIKYTKFAEAMIELERVVLAHRDAEGPVDLRDHDERYRPMRPGPQQERFARGQEAYIQEDYEAAFRIWLPLAEEGYAEAQYEIGNLHSGGLGVDSDRAKAEHYLRLAADQGYAPAESVLITFHNFMVSPFSRSDNEDDHRLSIYWARRAASHGDIVAYWILAFAYCDGIGLPRNPVLADVWTYMQVGSDDLLRERQCAEGIEYPASYREAIRERAEAMSKAYDIPIAPDVEWKNDLNSANE